jgi:hypothetical protein
VPSNTKKSKVNRWGRAMGNLLLQRWKNRP